MKNRNILFFLLLICLLSISQVSAQDASDSYHNATGLSYSVMAVLEDNSIESDVGDLESDSISVSDLSSDYESNLKSYDSNSLDILSYGNSDVLGGSEVVSAYEGSDVLGGSVVKTKLSTNSSKQIYAQLGETEYYIKLLDVNRNPLSGQLISLDVLNDTFSAHYESLTNDAGVATFHFHLDVGIYQFQSSYGGNGNYSSSSFGTEIKIMSTILSNDLTTHVSKRKPFVVNVVNSDGTYASDITVFFEINGKIYNRTTDYFGQAKLDVKLDKGTYRVKTTANGFSIYNTITIVDNKYYINSTNFHNYFNELGILKDQYGNSELVFCGDFKDFGVITINSPSIIYGEKGKLYNTVFHLQSPDISLSNICMYLTDSFKLNEYAGIFIDAPYISVSNIFMNYTAPIDKSAIGVLSYDSENLHLINNTIVLSACGNGDYYWGVGVYYSDSSTISGNNITCSLPLRNVDWTNGYSTGIKGDHVAGVAVQSSDDLIFMDNYVNVSVNSRTSGYPTIDAVIIHSCDYANIYRNIILEEDFITPNGTDNYLYALDVYMSNHANVLSNEIHVKTSGGMLSHGTAYCIQVAGPLKNLTIAYNNLSTINNGPNLGIYSQNSVGETQLFILSNHINVTGLAGLHEWALVAGIEVQDTKDVIWNNTIEVHNLLNSTKGNAYGISYSQSTSGNHSYDIQYNKVITDSKYAVYINAGGYIKDTIVSNNYLVTKLNEGNDAVYVGGNGNYIGGNNGDGKTLDSIPENLLRLLNALNSRGSGFSGHYGYTAGLKDNGGDSVSNTDENSSSNTSVNNGTDNSNGNSNNSGDNYNGSGNFLTDNGSFKDNPSPGFSGNELGASSNDGASGASAANAYELSEKDISSFKTTDNYSLLVVLIVILLLIIGYKKKGRLN